MYHNVIWKLDQCPIFVFALVKFYVCVPHMIHSGKQNLFTRTTIRTTFHTFLEVTHPEDTRTKNILYPKERQKNFSPHETYISILHFEC